MNRHFISQKTYLKVAQTFDWAEKEHYLRWFTGTTGRHRRTEVMLPRLVRNKMLRCVKFGRKLVYRVPRLTKREPFDDWFEIKHGLGVTEGLVRFWLSDRNCEIIPARRFRGYGVRPEWALKYPNTMLLYEFCTEDNARRINVIKNKVRRYSEFVQENCVVLFVMDIPRVKVIDLIEKIKPEELFMFTDYQTFKSVPNTEQLAASIYLWGDGKEYPLRWTGSNF